MCCIEDGPRQASGAQQRACVEWSNVVECAKSVENRRNRTASMRTIKPRGTSGRRCIGVSQYRAQRPQIGSTIACRPALHPRQPRENLGSAASYHRIPADNTHERQAAGLTQLLFASSSPHANKNRTFLLPKCRLDHSAGVCHRVSLLGSMHTFYMSASATLTTPFSETTQTREQQQHAAAQDKYHAR